MQEFYNYKFREEGLSPKTLRNYHMALHKCLQQAIKERLLVYNPCDAVTLPGGEKPEIVVFTNDQQRALVQASYRHRYGVFIRLDLCTGLRMGELLALKWEDIDFSTAQLHVRRTINRLAKYEAHDGENKTEIVFGTPKTKNSRRTIPLTRTMADELARWKQQQAQDKIRAGDKYTDYGFIVTNEFGHYFEQKTFKDYYDRLLKDADIGHFTFHALRHTFATRALERGMDYKTLSAILGHYSVAFTMDTYVHSMDEHKRREMDKMDDMFGIRYSISVENQPYPVLCTLSADGCTAHVPDFPKIEVQTPTLDAALLEVKQQKSGRYIQQKYLAGTEGKILSDIASGMLYLRHLPQTYQSGRTIDAARFIMITAAFEWEYKRNFPDGVPKKEARLKAEAAVTDEIDEKIKSSAGKKREIYKFLKRLVKSDSLESEIIHTGKVIDDIIGVFGKHLYHLNGEELKYSEMGKRLSSQRNHYAHGDLDQEFIGLSLLDLMYMEYVLYAIQLNYYGIDEKNIRRAINDLFHLNYAIT